MRLAFDGRFFALAAVSVIALSCSSSSSEDRTTLDDLPAVTIDDLEISSGTLLAPYDAAAPEIEVSSLHTRTPITITVKGTPGGSVLIDGVTVATNAPYALTLPRLAQDAAIHVQHRDAAGAIVDQTIRTLPTDFPAYTVTKDEPLRGEIYLTAYGVKGALPPYILILDEVGSPLFYERMATTTTDFRWVTLPDGRVRYVYFTGAVVGGVGTGSTVVLGDDFRTLQTIRLRGTDDHPAHPTDAHDFYLFDDDHYIATAGVTEALPDPAPEIGASDPSTEVIAAVLQEVKDGEVVAEWDSARHPELLDAASDGNDYDAAAPADYVHFNSIDVDPTNGRWIVSLRHQDAILGIDPTTGATAWTLGGKGDQFGLTADQKFSHQHFVRRQPDGSLLLFDNGNARQRTRIVQLSIDPATHALRSFDAWDTGRFSSAMGSVQKLDDATYFIGWGLHADGLADVTEVDRATGRIRFSLDFAESRYASYRALKRTDVP